jgi:GT2 family glycosyltransferase/glycosyltransferase involved in cell wall biosynthesis
MRRSRPLLEETLVAAPPDATVADVDVIVTVYDALEHVRACLDSLEQHADGFKRRVIVVDDASGPETKRWLRGRAERWSDLHLVEHERNLGYTRTVNHGLRISSARWVVLLNSDTIVSEGWLAGMVRCAQADPSVGMVGPLSNAASWQSVPEVADRNGRFKVNRLEAGLDVRGMAELVRSCSTRRYPKLPVLNGFCLLLRRQLLERVGFMDELTFPFGYGEENDYCMRATQAGFRLAVADDVYVFHAKSKSFGAARRREYSRRAARAIGEKHGEARVQELIRATRENLELQAARDAVVATLAKHRESVGATETTPLRVLFLLAAVGASGGASSVIVEAAEMAAQGAVARVIVPARALGELGAIYREVPNVRDLLRSVPLQDLVDFSKDFDVVVATAYYTMEWVAHIVAGNPAILPAYYVQDYEPWFHPEGSQAALAAAASYSRSVGALLFAKTDFLVQLLAARHAVHVEKVPAGIDHGVYWAGEQAPTEVLHVTAMVRPQTPRRAAPRTMRVLCALSRRYPERIAIHVFGCASTDSRFRELVQDFRFTNHGVLRRTQVAELLRETHVFVDLSDYQAFGRTAVEAMASGAVPVVPRAGGAGEFATHGGNALVVDTEDEASCVEQIASLIQAPEKLAPMRRAALATAAAFTHEAAARRQLELMAEALQAPRGERFAAGAPRLALVRPGGVPRGRLALGAALASWKAPCVQKKWRISEECTLPTPGSADVAIVALPLSRTNWPVFARWLRRWRRAGGRSLLHLELPKADGWFSLSGLGRAAASRRLGWLSEAADAFTVSTEHELGRLKSAGFTARLVVPALDPIVWRLGPAERGPPARTSSSDQIRVGLFGARPSPELRQAVGLLKRAYAGRVSVEQVVGERGLRGLGKKLAVPRSFDEAALADWAFEAVDWDVALIPEAEPSLETELQQLELAALGAPSVRVGTDAARACHAVRELVDDASARARAVAEARSALEARQSSSTWGAGALELLEQVHSAPAGKEPPRLLASVDVLASGLRWGWYPRGSHARDQELAFPQPLSKAQRKLAKLRRDPGAFFRDARLGPLRLFRGFFD